MARDQKNSILERTHIISQAAVNVVTALALVAAGMWAIYTTSYIKQEQKISEFTLRELMQKTELSPSVRTKLSVKVNPLPHDVSTILVNVKISNQGTQMARVNLGDPALTLVPIKFHGGSPQYLKEIPLGHTRYHGAARVVGDYIDVGKGDSYDVTYLFQAPTGNYLVRFLANMEGEYYDEYLKKVSAPKGLSYSTGADKYISIP
ncbi:MAG: hypothetical protein ACRCTL_12205 [Pseudomonas sp.]